MKMKKIIIILIFNLLFSSLLFSQTMKETWTYHNPKPQEKGLYAVFIADSLTIFAAGEEGTIIRTKDKGKNWDILSSGTSKKINSLYFIDKNTGYAFGDSGIVLKTYNGGDTWNISKNNQIGNIRSCRFINENKGWICDSNGRLYVTENGGLDWILQYHKRPEYFNKIFFIDNTTGWAAGTIIIKTTDGGMNWEKVETGFDVEFNDIYFLNSNEGWAAGEKGTIGHTTDCGNNWELMDYVTESTLDGIYFYNENRGYIITDEELASTVDAGKEWKMSFKMNKGKKNIHFNKGIGFVVNDNGEIKQTWCAEKSIKWRSYSGKEDIKFQAIDFIDENHGWIIGIWGRLLVTTNGGQLWIEKNVEFSSQHSDIAFKDINHGWIIQADIGEIFHTSDGGESWDIQVVDPDPVHLIFTKIFIKNNGNVWISGPGLYESTDNGASWNKYGPDVWFRDISFSNDTLGFATSTEKTYYTTDCGKTWNIHNDVAEITNETDYVFFADNLNGWIVPLSRGIIRTTDGGFSWNYIGDIPVNDDHIFFNDSNEGWSTKFITDIYYTNDGGISWEKNAPDFWYFKYGNVYHPINDIHFLNRNHGWFIGTNQLLLEYKREVITEPDTTNNEEPITPGSFNLIQNYPNPFNTETTIKYDVKENIRTEIKIYNLRGQEIKTLINEYKYAGSYYVTWNGRDNSGAVVSSGIYICTMKAAKYIKSIKLVFLK